MKNNDRISVKMRLPPRSGPYLCHCTRGDFERQILTWNSDTQTWFRDTQTWEKMPCCTVDVTQYVDFWMELPSPPENGKE